MQTAYAGDVILTTPLAEALGKLFPDAKIHFVARPDAAVLLKNNPYVHHVWKYDKRGSERGFHALLRWMAILRNEKYDLAVVPHRSLRSALLIRGTGIKRRLGFSKSSGYFLFTDRVKYNRSLHEVERNLQLLKPLGFSGPVPLPKLYPGREEKERIDEFLKQTKMPGGKKILAMAPGSLWPTKRWPWGRFAETAAQVWKRWRIPVILIGSRMDIPIGVSIAAQCREGFFNAMGQLSFLESAELVRRSTVILTNDSAPLHLAVAVGTPVVAIFGPTVTGMGFGPFDGRNQVIEADISCRPCSAHGTGRCPERHFRCMLDVSAERVIEALAHYLR